jgi:antitoxin MazE
MSTTIQKWGNSQGVRIPKNILNMMSWDTNQEIELIPDPENGQLVLAKVDNRNSYLEKLFEDFDGVYQTEEFDWGEPQGDEVW